MCGITGILTSSSIINDLHVTIASMTQTLSHRGPDSCGVWVDKESSCAMGHRRLSILELSNHGSQPMHSPCQRYTLVFNGEIYNHLSLRAELINSGYRIDWRGYSDTETLLACIVVWGIRATLIRTLGMFALALWDSAENQLTLARDRFGEKPLYWGWVGQGDKQLFVYGSELKSIKACPGFDNKINRSALSLYLQYSIVPSPHSIYQDIYKLSPGCFLTLRAIDRPKRLVCVESYWHISDVVRNGLADPIVNEKEAVSMLDDTLRKAVALQAVADVPLGAFLSGGVDSSTIAALMQVQSASPIKTFTIGFDEVGFDEAPYALAVAHYLGTEHHEVRVTAKDTLSVIPLLPHLYDEPFADSSQIPTYFLCQSARNKVVVALSGDAADELFGGYNRYTFSCRLWNKIQVLPTALREVLGHGIQRLSVKSWDHLACLLPGKYGIDRLGDKAHKLAHCMTAVHSVDELALSFSTAWPKTMNMLQNMVHSDLAIDNVFGLSELVEPEHRMMLLDAITYLSDDILTKVDRAAMGVSLETRMPFLDHRVVELAWRLPLKMKIRDGQGKWALRQVLYNYVPKELIERPKAGFAIPVGVWLRGTLREWAEELLDAKRLEEEGYLNSPMIREVWKQHLSGRYDWTSRLWTVLMFQAWLEQNR